MFEVSGLPPQNRNGFELFTPQGGSTSAWQTWRKPRGISMVYIMAVGSGGGGGGGLTNTNGNARGGGGGGGSGALTRTLIEASRLPGILYVQPGVGGLGSTGSGAAGGDGNLSYVSLGGYPGGTAAQMIAAVNLFVISGAIAAKGGAAGTAGGGVAGGAGGTIGTTTQSQYTISDSLWFAVGGSAGGNGGAAASAGSSVVTIATTLPNFSGGAGGGSTTAADKDGGAQTGVGLINTILGGTTGAINGGGGRTLWNPLLCTGGSGGAGINLTAGGAGGAGGLACGGGGGGGGTTGGVGGRGGDGFVLFISW